MNFMIEPNFIKFFFPSFITDRRRNNRPRFALVNDRRNTRAHNPCGTILKQRCCVKYCWYPIIFLFDKRSCVCIDSFKCAFLRNQTTIPDNIGWEMPILARARTPIKHTRHYHIESHASSIQIPLWINRRTVRHGRSPSGGKVERSKHRTIVYVRQTRRIHPIFSQQYKTARGRDKNAVIDIWRHYWYLTTKLKSGRHVRDISKREEKNRR